jgi:hypothetical protein
MSSRVKEDDDVLVFEGESVYKRGTRATLIYKLCVCKIRMDPLPCLK